LRKNAIPGFAATTTATCTSTATTIDASTSTSTATTAITTSATTTICTASAVATPANATTSTTSTIMIPLLIRALSSVKPSFVVRRGGILLLLKPPLTLLLFSHLFQHYLFFLWHQENTCRVRVRVRVIIENVKIFSRSWWCWLDYTETIKWI
jgi:hypothetical protein